MISEASTPRPGAAKGVVPKKGMGMVFWIDGVPGMADMVKVEVPSMIAAGIRRRGMAADAEEILRHRRDHEEGDEQADAAIGDDRSAQNDRENGALRAELLGHEIGDRRHRAAVLHQLAEQRAEQEERKELGQKAGRAAHERLRPVGEQRLPRKKRRRRLRRAARARGRSSP